MDAKLGVMSIPAVGDGVKCRLTLFVGGLALCRALGIWHGGFEMRISYFHLMNLSLTSPSALPYIFYAFLTLKHLKHRRFSYLQPSMSVCERDSVCRRKFSIAQSCVCQDDDK